MWALTRCRACLLFLLITPEGLQDPRVLDPAEPERQKDAGSPRPCPVLSFLMTHFSPDDPTPSRSAVTGMGALLFSVELPRPAPASGMGWWPSECCHC